jgi:phosphoribosylamine---glycine ligase
LYVGLMIDNGEPRVVEFNARFGDPETQAILRVFDGDLAALLHAAAAGELKQRLAENPAMVRSVEHGAACCVVLASAGYPREYATGKEIRGLQAAVPSASAIVFHSGTQQRSGGDTLVTSGGRVLAVTGTGATLAEAVQASYAAVEVIDFEGKTFRRDIGAKGMASNNPARQA